MYWINEALRGLPPVLWMCIGLGLPWALALLSTKGWQSRALVAALALALGPALMSAWMLALGVVGAEIDTPMLNRAWIIGGSIVISGAGCWIAWRKRPHDSPNRASSPLAIDEKLIVAMITVALALRLIHIAFWPFTWYDSLWVYGYQGRIYFLEGLIPHSIDYYPQFLQLQYAYVQIVIGAINDHAARMVLPTLHLGSILAAYLLGERLISRRAGLFAAGLWSLHPFVGQWSTIGDLEIPLTFSFTLAAVFFLRAWFALDDERERRRHALIAGLLLGIALFTKPTAAAFVWGVLILLAADLARVRFDFESLDAALDGRVLGGIGLPPAGRRLVPAQHPAGARRRNLAGRILAHASAAQRRLPHLAGVGGAGRIRMGRIAARTAREATSHGLGWPGADPGCAAGIQSAALS